MSVLTLYPRSDVSIGANWTKYGADPFWHCVDETNADDTDFLSCAATSPEDCRFGLDSGGLGDLGIISSVDVYIVCRSTNVTWVGSCKTLLYTYGTAYYDGGHNPGTGYTTYSYTYAKNPYTNNAWTWDEIRSQLQIGVNGTSGLSSNPLRCTQIYVKVTYAVGAPVLDTNATSDITKNEATGNGDMTNTGGATVTRRGFCYKAVADDWILPTSYSDPDSKWGAEPLAYDNDVATPTDTQYTGSYLYLYPSFAVYGSKIRIYASSSKPSPLTYYDPNISIDILSGGSWTNIFSGTITKKTWVEKTFTACTVDGVRIKWNGGDSGVELDLCELWFYGTAVSTSDSVVYVDNGFGTGSYSLGITGLVVETDYLIRAYATNSQGTGYGNATTFTTLPPSLPGVPTIDDATLVTSASARLNAEVSDDGGIDCEGRFKYREVA